MKIIKVFTLLAGVLLFPRLQAAEREIQIEITVPDTTWAVGIDQVVQVDQEIWVVATLRQDPGMMGAMVISTVKDSVKVEVEDLPVKYFVLGKTWNWENEEPYTFLKDLKRIKEPLGSGKRLYSKEK